MKNFLMVLSSIFLSLVLLEIGSGEYIKNKKNEAELLLPGEARIFYEKYYKDLHHLRGFVPFQGKIPPLNLQEAPSNAMFTTIKISTLASEMF